MQIREFSEYSEMLHLLTNHCYAHQRSNIMRKVTINAITLSPIYRFCGFDSCYIYLGVSFRIKYIVKGMTLITFIVAYHEH